MARIVVLMGPQGAGKGTQAQLLATTFGLPIVATGDILREMAEGVTPLGRQIREVQSAGHLVSDEILAEVIKARLGCEDCKSGCILDGFPRTLPQAELLEEIASSLGNSILVINLDVPRKLLYERLARRRDCSKCGAVYNVVSKPSKQEGICDLDGAPLLTRSDDHEEAIAKRLALYDEKTRPLLDYYGESGRLRTVDGTGTPEEVFARLSRIFQVETAESSKK